jgi:hypothetical protein
MNEELSSLLDGKYWSRSHFEHRDTRGLRAKQEPFESPTKIRSSPKKKGRVANPKTEEEREAIRKKRQTAREALQKSLNAKQSLQERQAQLESRGFEIFRGVILGVRKTEIDLRSRLIDVQAVLNVGDDTSNHYPNDYEYHHVPIKEVDYIELETLLKALNFLRSCYEDNKPVLVFDRNGTRALTIIVGFAIGVSHMTFEQALDHVHSFIGNDLIELRSNFRPCIENWENVLGAVDNFDDDDQPDEHNEDQQVDDELDMAAIEEDEPIPVEEDMSMFSVDPDLLAESVITINSNRNKNNTNERKRKRSSEEEDSEVLLSNRAKKQKVDQATIKRELNQSNVSIQLSCEEDACMTINTTSLQISEEEEDVDNKASVIVATKPLQLALSSESKEEPFDNQSMSSSSTASMFSKFKFAGLKKYAKAFEDNGYDDLDYLIELVDDEAEFNKMLTICGVDKPGHIDQLKKSLMALKSKTK